VVLGLGVTLAACFALAFLVQGRTKDTGRFLAETTASEIDPNWGCGLLGFIPGISPDGKTTSETQRFIDGLKNTSTFNKVSYWNWNLAPEQTREGFTEYLSKDFLFMPEQWGPTVPNAEWVREAGQSPFIDGNGLESQAEMANVFLGMNEPDIQGSCMGSMFGTCVQPCTAAFAASDCPTAWLESDVAASPNALGMCNCWEHSQATGCGFWPVQGCSANQPLPDLWNQEEACIDTVMSNWKQTAMLAWNKGYKYLSTPLMAVYIDYAEKFIEKACGCENGECACTDASCGCPVYVGVHFYAFDCRPEEAGGYETFQERLSSVAQLMEKYPFVKGAHINEVGMLNCAPTEDDPICVPNSGKYPANEVADHGCPSNDELPNGLATFIDKLFDLVIQAKTADGRSVVKSFAWFNIDQAGGTYNLRLFDEEGSVNKAGEAYMRACQKWASS